MKVILIHSGTELASCGTKCMLGIAAGIIFLVTAVAIVVACWKLDRVQKVVRGKFNNENQDLQVPISDYVDRGLLPETIHLSFDMTTSLNHVGKMAVSFGPFSHPQVCDFTLLR